MNQIMNQIKSDDMRIFPRMEGDCAVPVAMGTDFMPSSFKTIIKEMSDAVFLTRDDGTFVFVCPNVNNIFGYSSDDVLAMESIYNFLPFSEVDLSSVVGGIDELVKIPCITRNRAGNYRHLEVTIKSVEIEEGTRLITCHDTTAEYRLLNDTIVMVSKTLEMRDPYTGGHQSRVAELAGLLGERLGLTQHEIRGLRLGAQVHDIGKIAVPQDILNKPGRISAAEMELIKVHPRIGFEILSETSFPWAIAEMAHQHHERLDGTGYPQGLVGDEIIKEARIIAVADTIEAMTSHRPYRPAKTLEEAMNVIRDKAGLWYDPEVVAVAEQLLLDGLLPISGWDAT